MRYVVIYRTLYKSRRYAKTILGVVNLVSSLIRLFTDNPDVYSLRYGHRNDTHLKQNENDALIMLSHPRDKFN